MVACRHGKSDVAIVLIKSGANVNVKDMVIYVLGFIMTFILISFLLISFLKQNGSSSPLALAASVGLTDVVEVLIENNARLNEVDMVRNLFPKLLRHRVHL